jgi:hypothetical protein
MFMLLVAFVLWRGGLRRCQGKGGGQGYVQARWIDLVEFDWRMTMRSPLRTNLTSVVNAAGWLYDPSSHNILIASVSSEVHTQDKSISQVSVPQSWCLTHPPHEKAIQRWLEERSAHVGCWLATSIVPMPTFEACVSPTRTKSIEYSCRVQYCSVGLLRDGVRCSQLVPVAGLCSEWTSI